MRPCLVLLSVVLLSAGCARPTGDFGRARPSVLHDREPSVIGQAVVETLSGTPASSLNLTDTERELRDRSWAFVRPPHAGDWWTAHLVSFQRLGVIAPVDETFDPRAYYDHLRADPYRSSEGRWSRVMLDIQADALLVPPFCEVAARVRRVDVERLGALRRLPSVDETLAHEAEDRVAENDAVMAWVWRAVAFRLAAYRDAIDRLTVETPSDQLLEANRVFGALAAARCEDAPASRLIPGGPPRSSRVRAGPDPFDQPVLQK